MVQMFLDYFISTDEMTDRVNPNVHLAGLDRMVIQSVEGKKTESVIQTREFSNAVLETSTS
jgi:hypothetical protein